MKTMPMEPNDELLCAYLDGELDAATRAEADQALARDPGARLRLERMRRADARLREAFPLQPTAADDALAARILAFSADGAATGGDARAAGSSTVTPLRKPAEVVLTRRRPLRLAALAAAVSAVAVGYLLRMGGGSENPTMTAFNAALDRAASGEQVQAGPVALQPVLSFRAADGRYCRVYEQSAAGTSSEGLACREAGGWQVLAQAPSTTAPGALQPAGGNAEVDALMNRLGGEPALDAAAERALIAKGWQPPR